MGGWGREEGGEGDGEEDGDRDRDRDRHALLAIDKEKPLCELLLFVFYDYYLFGFML